MYCNKCGTLLNENTRICPQCGAPVVGQERNLTTTSTYQGPLGNPVPVLVWGIIGLSFALTFYLSFLGVIFSFVGLSKSNKYRAFTGDAPSNMAKIGRRLSIAGIIVGIILTILCAVFVFGMIYAAKEGYLR